MAEQKVGEVVKFFSKAGVAAIKVTEGTIRVGDRIKFKGHSTDFEDQIQSMQIENQPVEKAEVGQMIGVKVKDRVREKDAVYKITD
jgi:translation elongation factor EF-1alpha